MSTALPAPADADFFPNEKPTQEEGRAALRYFFTLLPKWQITDAQARILLGDVPPATYYRWKKDGAKDLPGDLIWRLGDILGIAKGLRYLFIEPERGYQWLHKPNKAFAGKSALDLMLVGHPASLTRVRRYIDAERGGW